VRKQRSVFRSCEVKYAQAKGLPRPDVALAFPELGFHLLFDGAQQRLRLIEVHDATRLQLSYGGRLLGGGPSPPRFGRVCEELGPTYPGEPAAGVYPLQYPGVIFLFPLAPGTAAAAAAGQPPRPSMSSSIAGVEFPVALSTPAARILIHHGSAACLAAARAAPPPPLPAGGAYFEPVEALAGQGLLLSGSGACLRFGDSPQDVISELGEPSSTHTKPGRPGASGLTAPSQPGAAGTAGGSASGPADYYFCYAERGIDVLFCGSSHRLKKLVLHANAPGHPDFGLYRKCSFRVHPAGSWSLPGSSSDGTGLEGGGMGWEGGNGGSPHARSSGSEGAGSMKTAASHASLPGEEVHGAAGGLVQQQQPPPPPPPQQQQQQHWGVARHAAHANSAAAARLAAVEQEQAVAGCDASDAGQQQAGAAAPLGRPPRPPSTLPVATPPPASSSKSGASKKKKKKERQRAAAAAKLLGVGSGSGDESAADTDTSFADSAPSSLASSPGMTSFLSSIAATGGTVGSRLAGPTGGTGHGAAEAAALPSGYSSDGGSQRSDFLAGKERRMECGSAFDGWSEAEDLNLLVGGDEPAAPAAAAAPADSAAEQLALQCSTAVQTAPVDEADLLLGGLGDLAGYQQSTAAAAAPAEAGGGSSPDSFVLAESPALFDEGVAATEYEAVPHLRSCSTQTQPYHVPAGAARRPGSAASGSVRLRRPPAAASAACVGVDGSLADIRAAFGSAAKPALHTRLGGRHPFGPTHLYAFQGAVFEVTRSGTIATLTLFEA
jgi:hypothetical protein